MKINKRLLILIPVICGLTLIVGCNKSEYCKLSEEDESAWGIYEMNEEFKMISTQGDLRNYTTGGRFKAYNRDGNTYEEYLYTTVYLQDDSGYQCPFGYNGLFLDQTTDGLTVKVSLPHFYANVQINNTLPTVQMINGKLFTDVYIAASNPFLLDSVNYIDTIFYSQAYGFLKYVDIYGETYTRTQ